MRLSANKLVHMANPLKDMEYLLKLHMSIRPHQRTWAAMLKRPYMAETLGSVEDSPIMVEPDQHRRPMVNNNLWEVGRLVGYQMYLVDMEVKPLSH